MAGQPESQIGRNIRRAGALLTLAGGLLTVAGAASEFTTHSRPAICAAQPRSQECETVLANEVRDEAELFGETIGAVVFGCILLANSQRIERAIIFRQATAHFDQQLNLLFANQEGPGDSPQ